MSDLRAAAAGEASGYGNRSEPLFRITDLHAGYGATPILFGVSLEVHAGEAVALLGKNGMGKTTLMKTAMGFLRPTRGSIAFEGAELTRLTPHEIARLGVGLVPENRRVFPGLTVRENLELGLFPRLAERIGQPAKTLSGGEQQMLAIARVMMAGARIILMDEPTQGLAPALIRHIRDMIAELKRLRVTVLLVEQNSRVALSVCDRGYVMEKGAIVFQGSSAELRDSAVTREKLGV